MTMPGRARLALKGLQSKKTRVLIMLMLTLSFLLLMLAMSFKQGLDNFVTDTILNNIDARRLMVHTEETSYEFDEAIKIVGELDHVLQTYSHEKAYSSGILNQKFNGYDGELSLSGAAANTLPEITEGRPFSDIERKAIIIPEKFIPDSDPDIQMQNRSNYIDGRELIGETLTILYHENTYDENLNIISSQPRKCSFTVVGVYDSQHVFKNNNTCYIAYDDIYHITKEKNGNIYDYSLFNYCFHVIVDDYQNLSSVEKAIEKMGLHVSPAYQFTTTFAYAIAFAANAMALIILAISLAILFSSIVKSVWRNIKYIGLLKTIGYTDKDIMVMLSRQYAAFGAEALLIALLLSAILNVVIARVLLEGEITMSLLNGGTLLALIITLLLPLVLALVIKLVLRKIAPVDAMRVTADE